MIAFEEVSPADRDVTVNGPLWDSHVIPTIEETTTEIADRRRMLKQASRRIKRSVDLIQDLRDQLERAEHMAECKITELANFHQGAEDASRAQSTKGHTGRQLGTQDPRTRSRRQLTWGGDHKRARSQCNSTAPHRTIQGAGGGRGRTRAQIAAPTQSRR